jgi:hypothetical protein
MECKHCHKELDSSNLYGKGIFCSKRCQLRYGFEQKKEEAIRKTSEKNKYKRTIIKIICAKCGKEFEQISRGNGKNEKGDPLRIFCSYSCANSRKHNQETKVKISGGIRRFLDKNPPKAKSRVLLNKVCDYCGKEFTTFKINQTICSMQCNGKRSSGISNLRYRKDEIPVKNRLESLLSMTFSKEKIENSYIDFANSKYLIEYTIDKSRGMYEAIDRLYKIADKREKILISHVDHIGKKIKEKCKNIKLITLHDFWNNDKVNI